MKKKAYLCLGLLVLGELAFGASAKKYANTRCTTKEGAAVYRDRFGDFFTKNVVRGQAYYFPAMRQELVDGLGRPCLIGAAKR
ncbi:MAG: hypothetical protein EOP11_05735 [Proteobacteria bacterium]|nr:MAG: hypothetical protein EOP11_05735 [Pseudomonadota bacterium]